MLALIDIDGTIADCGHRLHFIQAKVVQATEDKDTHLRRPDWAAFFDAMGGDAPIWNVIRLVKVLSKVYKVIYVTGRPDSHRDNTWKWLRAHQLPDTAAMYMRPIGDHRPDHQVKMELYLNHIIPCFGPAELVIEDRKQVVDMWRSLGILTLQPKDGDY